MDAGRLAARTSVGSCFASCSTSCFTSPAHVARGESQTLPVNVVLGGLAAFVARGRFEKAPVAPR